MAIILKTGENYTTDDKVIHEVLYGVLEYIEGIDYKSEVCKYTINFYNHKTTWEESKTDPSIKPVDRKRLACHGADFDTYLGFANLSAKGMTVRKALYQHAMATTGWNATYQSDGGLDITNVPAL